MAGFVLIHGSWHGGWCFDEIARNMVEQGHAVIAPTLPGMGGDEAELRAVTLDDWADFANAACHELRDEGFDPIVLVGHSRGGIVISTAAERDPQACDLLIYIAAIMLPDGMSRSQFRAQQAPNPAYDALVRPVHNGAGSVIDPAGAAAVFAQLSPPDLVAQALPRLVAEPTSVRDTPVRVSPRRWGSLPRLYVECTEDRTIPLASQRMMQELCPGAVVVSLETDHSPFFSAPDELTEVLLGTVPVVL